MPVFRQVSRAPVTGKGKRRRQEVARDRYHTGEKATTEERVRWLCQDIGCAVARLAMLTKIIFILNTVILS